MAQTPVPVEVPSLAPRVESGELPPVAERLPAEPQVVDLKAKGRAFGRNGGELHTLFTRSKDIRYMVVYGYARLVGYDPAWRLQPDILRAVDVEGGRIFTLSLREGHRWSDGAPFTTDDFRYWWEDVANNEALSPNGPPELMLAGGKPPAVTVIDETTIRYEWETPNPRFLPALAAARPLFIYRPAHYLKKFHIRYASLPALEPLIRESRSRNWAQLHNKLDEMYNFTNPDLPTLQPWFNTSVKNGRRYVLTRNPFFHRMDARGVQLPYIDRVEATISAPGLVASKVTLGESDLQIRSLSFGDAPVLKKGEATGDYATFLWSNGAASEIALHPSLNFADPGFRALLRDARFRQALSLGIDRHAINKSLYYGLAKERAVAALEGSPFFDEAAATAFAAYDPDRAGALLDDIGLTERDGSGIRLLPDGRRLEVVVESAGERPVEADAMELVAETWREIGVQLVFRPVDRDVMRNSAYRGMSMMPLWFGWNNGIPTADTAPTAQTPVDQANLSWPLWGQYFQTKGRAGEPPDMPEGKRLLALFETWNGAATEDARAAAWREILAIHAANIFSIGIVSAAPQPIIVSNHLRNVPQSAVYSWAPGAHLGVYRIDEFWFDE